MPSGVKELKSRQSSICSIWSASLKKNVSHLLSHVVHLARLIYLATPFLLSLFSLCEAHFEDVTKIGYVTKVAWNGTDWEEFDHR